MDVLTIGETMLVVSPDPGHGLTLDASFGVGAGGAESNVAIALAQLGLDVAWASRLGDDPVGRLVRGAIEQHGVDVSRVETVPGVPSGVYFKNPLEQQQKVVYYRAGSAASTMDAAFLTALADADPRIVHVSGITAALSSACGALLDAVVRHRVLGAATVVFDVNYRPALWSVGEAAPRLLELAAAADVVLVGRDEAEVLWQTPTAEDVRALLPGVAHLVVKDGDVEAVEFTADETVRVPAEVVDVVEPVGAGDAFAAGWEAGFLAGVPSASRLAAGHAAATAVLTSSGDHAPHMDAVRALLV